MPANNHRRTASSIPPAARATIADVAREASYLLMLFNLGNDSRREREAIEALTAYQVEGFILNTLGRDAGAAADAAG